MGYDCVGWQGSFHWTFRGWHAVLRLAEHHGWKPAGTGPPPRTSKANWNGAYVLNMRQYVYKGDARALAQALSRALHHLPLTLRYRSGRERRKDVWNSSDAPALRAFIRFARKRGFRIW